MSDGIQIDLKRIELAFIQLAQYSAHSREFEFRSTCKGIVNQWINITPPAMGRAAKQSSSGFDAASQLRGFNAIKRDLRGLFFPVDDGIIARAEANRGAGSGNVRLFNQGKTPYGVTREHFLPAAAAADLRTLHKSKFKNGKLAKIGPEYISSGSMQLINRYVVRKSVMEAYLQTMLKHVGWLVSALSDIARLTGARLPSYGRSKRAPNVAVFTLAEARCHMKFECLIPWADAAAGGDYPRRFQAAIEYQANAMFRRIPKMIEAAARRAGFKSA